MAGDGRVDGNCRGQHNAARLAASAGGNCGARGSHTRRDIRRYMPDNRINLGAANMGNMVGMGWPIDINASAIFLISGLYSSRQCQQ